MTGTIPVPRAEPDERRDRRKSDQGLSGTVLSMQQRLDQGDRRMKKIEDNLAENTTFTKEIREIVLMGKSFFKVTGWLGNGIKWIATVVAAAGSLWYLFTHGPNK